MAREERAVLLLGFAKHGYVQGRNLDLVTYDFESAGGGQSSGTPGKQPGADLPYSGFLLAQMAQTRPEIILASGVRVVQGAQKSIRSTPVIFWRVTDPVGFGFVESLARPRGNFTGFSRAIDKLTVKRLELLHEMLPQARRIAFLYISDNEHHRSKLQKCGKWVKVSVSKSSTTPCRATTGLPTASTTRSRACARTAWTPFSFRT